MKFRILGFFKLNRGAKKHLHRYSIKTVSAYFNYNVQNY